MLLGETADTTATVSKKHLCSIAKGLPRHKAWHDWLADSLGEAGNLITQYVSHGGERNASKPCKSWLGNIHQQGY